MRLRVLLLVGGVFTGAAFAEEGAVHSDVDARRIGLEDVVQWTLTLEGAAVSPEREAGIPPLKNLKVVGGPSVSTEIALVNATMRQTRTYTYALQALAIGPAEIGAVQVKWSGGEQTAPAIALEVVAGRTQPARPKTRPAFPDPFGSSPFEGFLRPGREVEPKLFVEAVPSRTRVRVGEALLVTYYLYFKDAQPTDLQTTTPPEYPGFWAENLESGKSPPPAERVQANGEAFNRFPIYRKLLFATRVGRLTIPPLSVRVGVARRSFFDSSIAVERSTKPIAISVEPLPEEPGFTGAVGRFKVEAALDRVALPLGEAATLRFRVAGEGNLKWVDQGPALALSGAKVFPPQVKSELRAEASGLAGSKTWEYVVVPETSGTLKLPALSFSYFDPEAGRMVRAETRPLELTVAKAPGSAAAPSTVASGPAAGGLALRDALEARTPLLPTLSRGALLLAAELVALLHVLLFAGERLAWRLPGTALGASSRGRLRAARRDLARAREPGVSKEQAAALIEKALGEAFEGRDGGAQTAELRQAIERLLEEVHLVRYAPQLGEYSEKLREITGRAEELVRRWA